MSYAGTHPKVPNNILVIKCFDETDFQKYLDEIEKLLGKSEKTILNQRTAIYHKMFIQDRHDLIEKAKLLGVIF